MLFHAYAGVGFITYCYLEFRATRIELASLNAPQADVKEVLGEIVYASGRNTVLLASVAAFEFLGFMIDQIKHRQEAAESARLRDELDATMRIADDFALQMGPWRISERSGTAIKKKLSIPDYQGQKFVIYREYENIDGEPFANDLAQILVDCGWVGTVEIPKEPIPYIFPRGVCVWTSEAIIGGDIDRMQAIIQAMAIAGIYITDRQMWKAVTAKTIPPPNMVLFCVGKKPPL